MVGRVGTTRLLNAKEKRTLEPVESSLITAFRLGISLQVALTGLTKN